MASLSLKLKVFVCLLLVALSQGAEDESGQYNPELYEKPYETTDPTEEVTTTEVEETEAPETNEVSEEPEEPEETPEVVVSADNTPRAPPSLPALPYPLLYSPFAAPFIYSTPQYLRIAAGFPTVIV